MLKTIDELLAKVEKFLLIGIFIAMITLMTINIVQRNIFGQSSQGILEFLPTMVMWVSLIGASIGMRQGKHIRMELSLRFLPKPLQEKLHRAGAFFGVCVMLVGLYLSKDFMSGELKIFGMRGYLSSIIPIFFGMVAFRFFLLVVKAPSDHK